jgi:hypothetical protein
MHEVCEPIGVHNHHLTLFRPPSCDDYNRDDVTNVMRGVVVYFCGEFGAGLACTLPLCRYRAANSLTCCSSPTANSIRARRICSQPKSICSGGTCHVPKITVRHALRP